MKPRKEHEAPAALSDEALMTRAREGFEDAFVEIVRRYQDRMANFFRRLGVYTDVEDLVQDTFVRLYRSRERYVVSARFNTFLYRVARTVWLDRCRKLARRSEFTEEYEEHYAAVHPGSPPVTGAALDAQAALDALPDKYRLVVVLSLYQGLNYPEIAETLEIPEGTVKSRMHMAIEKLREAMNVRIA